MQTTADTPTKSPTDIALQFLWKLRALHRKCGAKSLLDLADRCERKGDLLYADLLRAIGRSDPSNERWDETFRVANRSFEVAG